MSLQSFDKINLQQIRVLIVDDNNQALDILAQVLTGFGVREVVRATSAEEAQGVIGRERIDLVLTDGNMPGRDGYDLVKWIRREAQEPNRYCPVVVVTGHTPQSQVARARDCGANFVIAKPLTPSVILDRIYWVAKDQRMFVDCDVYAGPDRRFKSAGPPAGEDGRREGDLSLEVGEAEEPNLDQDEVNRLVKPSKAVL